MADVTYRFLPWVRRGLAAAVTAADNLGTAPMPGLASFRVSVPVTSTTGPVAPPTPVPVTLSGPGDVIGFDRAQVIRTWPLDGHTDAEPTYFPLVEFDRPELPWLFTPAAPDTLNRLRPWLVLVVVEQGQDDCARLEGGEPLARLVVPDERAWELPDLADSWLWAHAQVTPAAGETTSAAVTGDPRRNLSRLLCPRRLQPHGHYVAAVVPAFASGRKAGLGEPVTAAGEAALEPAWVPDVGVTLPVYFHTSFATGGAGDFETLARRLQGRPVPEGVGTRPMDISRPGPGLPTVVGMTSVDDRRAVLGLEGALRRPGADPTEWEPAARDAFVGRLTVILDTPARRLAAAGGENVDEGPKTVAPPIYGQFHAATAVLGTGTPPPWLVELNLDPRPRVAAGLGTQVVQARQEDYMARAWRQVGDILEANRRLRLAQLARSGASAVHAHHLSRLDAADLLAVTAAVHARVRGVTAAADPTVAAVIRSSRLPDAAASTTFRRLARPQGRVARLAAQPLVARASLAGLATGEMVAAPVPTSVVPDGSVSLRSPLDVLGPALSATVMAKVENRAEEPGMAQRLNQFVTTLNAAIVRRPTGIEVTSRPINPVATAPVVLGSVGVVKRAVLAQPPVVGPLVSDQPAGTVRPRPTGRVERPGVRGRPDIGRPDVGRRERPERPDVARPERPDVGQPVRPLRPGDIDLTGPSPHRLGVETGTATLDVTVRLAAAAEVAPEVGRLTPEHLVAIERLVRSGEVFIDRDVIDNIVGSGQVPIGKIVVPPAGTIDVGDAGPSVVGEVVSGIGVAVDRILREADAPTPPPGPALTLNTVKPGLLRALDPNTTIPARALSLLAIPAALRDRRRDPLEEVMAAPAFRDPMYEPLRDLSEAWLLPGLEKVLPDTVTLVETNPGFVGAHMVGLNHEMARELLWREFPTDQRGTCFARFWGRASGDDIGPVHRFRGRLTENLAGGDTPQAVLLVRGELLQRYPGAIIYAARARLVGGQPQLDDSTIVPPDFRGRLLPDTTFVGFPLAIAELTRADRDWWFVLAEQPTEPRFGLDDTAGVPPGAGWTWNDLAWPNVAPTPDRAAEIVHAPRVAPQLAALERDGVRWAANAAGQAHACFQHPVRVAIRARALLGEDVLNG